MKEKDYRRGILLHQRLLKKSPRNALAMYHLGYAYGQIGDHAKEIAWYKKAITLGFREGQIFFNLGMAYGETNQIEEAIKALKEAVRTDPENAEYHFGLALAYRANGQERRCREELLETLKKEPGHTDAKRALQESHIDRQDGSGPLPMESPPPTVPSSAPNGSGFVMQIAETAIGMNGYVGVPEKPPLGNLAKDPGMLLLGFIGKGFARSLNVLKIPLGPPLKKGDEQRSPSYLSS